MAADRGTRAQGDKGKGKGKGRGKDAAVAWEIFISPLSRDLHLELEDDGYGHVIWGI